MKPIKINFVDFPPNFDKINNNYYNALSLNYKIFLDENPDFLFCSLFGVEHLKYKDCIKILILGENAFPNFMYYDYALSFNHLKFHDRHFRHSRYVKRSDLVTNHPEKRKFCNFIYSNEDLGTGAKLRKSFCGYLSKYKRVDCPGRILNNMKNAISPRGGNFRAGKLEFISNYKFTIAFENASAPGYITEKLLDPFISNSVPIYWGDPMVTKEFNPDSFINCHDFSNFDEVIDYIKFLDNDDDAYMKMLHASPMQPNYRPEEHDLSKFLLNIIEHGSRIPREPLDYTTSGSWWFCNTPNAKQRMLKGTSSKYSFLKNLKILFDNTPFLYSNPVILDTISYLIDNSLRQDSTNSITSDIAETISSTYDTSIILGNNISLYNDACIKINNSNNYNVENTHSYDFNFVDIITQ